MPVAPLDAVGFRRVGEPASATADLAPRYGPVHFISRLQRRQAVLEELEPLENVCISIDVDEDPGQPATLRHIKDVVGRFQRIELLTQSGAKIFSGYDSGHRLSIRSTVGFANCFALRGGRSQADGLGFEPKTALRLYSISSAAPSTGLGHPSSGEKSSGGAALSLLRSKQDVHHPKRVGRRQTGATYSRNGRRHIDSGVAAGPEVMGDDHSMGSAFAARSTLCRHLIVRP